MPDKARMADGTIANQTVCGRRHCHSCRRWRLTTDFSVRRWADAEKTVPRYFKADCKVCHRRGERRRWRNPDQRDRMYQRNLEWQAARRRERGVSKMPQQEYAKRYGSGTKDNSRVAIESFRPYWEMIIRRARVRFRSVEDMDKQWKGLSKGYSANGTFDINEFCVWAGITKTDYENLTRQLRGKASVQTLDLGLCDKVMTAAGLEDQVSMLYVVDSKGLALAA